MPNRFHTAPTQNRPRPGVLMRGAMAQAYGVRGNGHGKLWIQYSVKAKRDVAFACELSYLHFLYVESSFEVTRVDYAPSDKVTRAVGAAFASHVDAEIAVADGGLIWRHVSPSVRTDESKQLEAQLALLLKASHLTQRLETLGSQEILSSQYRIRNWHRIAAWLAAARDWDLHSYETEVAALIRRRGRVEFQEVLALDRGGDHGCLYGAALLQQVQCGAYRSNLFDAPFTMRSIFTEKGRLGQGREAS